MVIDTDGSAFITKAEFDSLKNIFQAQLDSYNSNIDSKIDSAIASYLAGISVSKTKISTILVPIVCSDGILSINEKNPLAYKTCIPVSELVGYRTDTNIRSTSSGYPMRSQPNVGTFGIYRVNFGPPTDKSKNYGNKTVIKSLDASKKIAAWEGYRTSCLDTVKGTYYSWNDQLETADLGTTANQEDLCFQAAGNYTNTNLIGQSVFVNRQINGGKIWLGPSFEAIVHDWGTRTYPYVCCTGKNYNYDLFSNYERDYNWSYPNTYGKKFLLPGTTDKYLNKETITWTGTGQWDAPAISDNCNIINAWNIMCGSMSADGWYNAPSHDTVVAQAGKITAWEASYSGYKWVGNVFNDSSSTVGRKTTYYPPFVGFETNYLTSWNNIYMDAYDSVLDDDTLKTLSINTILTDSAGKKHLSSCAGFPLFRINRDETLTEFKFSFADESASYNVWFKKGPFDKDKDPDSEACFDNVTGYQMSGSTKVPISKDGSKIHAYKVTGKETTISMPKATGNGVIFVKWAKINTGDRTKDGGGVFKPKSSFSVEK